MRYLSFLILLAAFASCQKEYSLEDVDITDPGIIVPEGCLIDTIWQVDAASGDKAGYLALEYRSDFRAVKLVDIAFPSTPLQQYDYTIEANNIVKISATEFFVVDPANNFRVTEHHLREEIVNPLDPDEKIEYDVTFTYNYDVNGYLQNKLVVVDGVEQLRTDYTWLNGNLQLIELKEGPTVLFKAEYTYMDAQPVKDFLNWHIDLQHGFVDMGLNMGKKSSHAVKSISIEGTDENGDPLETTTVNISNYVLDSDNRVKSFEVDNNNLAGFGIYEGLNQVSYKCP